MNKLLNSLKSYSMTYIFINIYIFLLIFMPKNYSNVFGLPIRLILTTILIFIIIIDIKRKKITIRKKKDYMLYILMILFIVAVIPSIFVSKNTITSLYTLIKFISCFSVLVIFSKVTFSKREYIILGRNLIVFTAILCITGILFYIFGINIMIKDAGIEYYVGAKGRLNVTFFNTIYYGIFLNLVFPFVFYLMCIVKSKFRKIILALICSAIYINLVFTFTRSSILIFLTCFLMLVVVFNKKILNIGFYLLIVIVVTSSLLIPGAKPLISKAFSDAQILSTKIFVFLPGINGNSNSIEDCDNNQKKVIRKLSKKECYLDDKDFVDLSLQHRESFANISKQIAKENILTGVGIGAYIDYMNSEEFDIKYPTFNLRKTHPHSTLLLIFAESGVFGLMFLVLILGYLVLKFVLNFIRNFTCNKLIASVSGMAFVTMMGYAAVNIISENAFYDTQVNFLFMLFVSLILSYCHVISDKKRVLFISSTGGHLSEMLQLDTLFDKYDSYLITEKTKSTLSLKKKYNKVRYLVYGTKDHKIVYPFKFIYNCFLSAIYYALIGPDVIITTGTHTAVPMCYIGKLFGSKIVFIETFANSKTKTLSGKIVYPIADLFVVQWEEMLKLYPKAIYGGWIY